MSLTKIGSIGINTGIQFAGVTTVSTLHVGSGVTLSSDGDGFYTGVVTATTFSGALAASNLTGALPAISGASLTGIDTDLVSDTSPQLGGNLDVNTKNIVFGDSGGATDDRLTFGAGTDLSIYHDGSNSYLQDGGTGDLLISGDSVSIVNAAASEFKAKFISDGAVELYHNNERKIYTHATGIQVEDATSTGASIVMSTSSGTSGSLYATGNNTLGLLDGQNHYMLKGVKDGAVELYHDNTKKFETSSDGITIVGSNNARFGDNGKVKLGDSDDLEIYHDGSAARLHSASHPFYIRSGGQFGVFKGDGSESMIVAEQDGEVKLYHNNVKHFETTSIGCKLFDDDTTAALQFANSAGDNGYVMAESTNIIGFKDSQAHWLVKGFKDGAVELYHDNSLRAYTTSNGLKVETTSTDNARVAFKTGNHDYSQIGYFGLNRFGIDTHDGLEVRDASDSYAVRLRITSSGQFKQFADQDSANGQLLENISSTNPEGLYIKFPNAAPNTSARHAFKFTDSVGDKAVIDSNGNSRNLNNSYGGFSDISLKENIVDAGSQWDDIKNIQVKVFNFKSESASDKRIGVIAQEIETVCPKLVSISYDKDTEGNLLETGVKSVKYSVLYMKAIKALQEAQSRIETLETKVAALEG